MRIPSNFSFLLSVFLIIVPLNVFAKEVKYPYQNFNVKNIYRLDNGKTIFIEQTGWGNTIWEKINNGELKKISHVWFVAGIAKECSDRNLKNIIFVAHKEYYLMGGIDENAPIRIHNLYNPQPYIDTALGSVPNMEYAKEWCKFYKPI